MRYMFICSSLCLLNITFAVEPAPASQVPQPDPRTLSVEAKASEDARIDAAIRAVRATVDAETTPATTKADAVITAFRKEATILTDLLRRQSLSEPSSLEAHTAATRIQKLVLGNTEWVLVQGNRSGVEAAPSEFVRDDTRATVSALRALIERSSAAYQGVGKAQEQRTEDLRRVIADLEAQRPAMRLEKMEFANLTRIVKLNEEALALAQETTASTAQPPSIQNRAALVAWLGEKEKASAGDRQRSGKILAEKVLPLTARARMEAAAAVGLPKSEEATRIVISRLDELAQALRQQSEFDVKPVIAHHRALVAGLPPNGTASGIAAVSAAVAADQLINPDHWSNTWMSAPWQEMLGAMVREAAQDPSIATMPVRDVVENAMRPWQIDPAGAQQGRYAPLLTALVQAHSIKSASEGDLATALEVLAKLPETQRQQLGELRIALEDAIGENHRATAGTGGLGTINAWTETRALSLPPDSRTHHIVLINRLNAGKTGDDVVKVESIIRQDIESNRIHWNFPGATTEMVNRIIDVYGKLQAAQYLGFKAKMVTPMAVMLEAAHHFDEGTKWGWGTYQEPVSGNGAKFTAAVRGIDKEEARVINLLGSGAALIPEAGPPTPALWHRIAEELGVAKP